MKYLVIIAILAGCGANEESKKIETVQVADAQPQKTELPPATEPLVNQPQATSYSIASIADLPACDDKNLHQIVYIRDAQELRDCNGSEWETVVLKAPAPVVVEKPKLTTIGWTSDVIVGENTIKKVILKPHGTDYYDLSIDMSEHYPVLRYTEEFKNWVTGSIRYGAPETTVFDKADRRWSIEIDWEKLTMHAVRQENTVSRLDFRVKLEKCDYEAKFCSSMSK